MYQYETQTINHQINYIHNYKNTHSSPNYGLHHHLPDTISKTANPEAIDDVCSGRGSRLIQARREHEAQAKRKWNQKYLSLLLRLYLLGHASSSTIQRMQGIHRLKQLSVEEPKLSVETWCSLPFAFDSLKKISAPLIRAKKSQNKPE